MLSETCHVEAAHGPQRRVTCEDYTLKTPLLRALQISRRKSQHENDEALILRMTPKKRAAKVGPTVTVTVTVTVGAPPAAEPADEARHERNVG